jgi:hypothetical protein
LRHIVITSIFPPTEAVGAFARVGGWSVVVVGDQKTPPGWRADGVEYLSPEWQEQSAFSLARVIPWNHYSRKMIGYLHAIASHAVAIADTDDDNIPYEHWGFPPAAGTFEVATASPFYNVYSRYTDARVWPRGYPLRFVRDRTAPKFVRAEARVGVWQALADGEPDVDAIYRLTVGEQVVFDDHEPIVLDEGTVCPFNSQNTLFFAEVFPLLYLPTTVTFRFTDILRSLVAQPILWAAGLRLGFLGATVRQERNDHELLDDFESEIPVYLHSQDAVAAIREAVSPARTIEDNLRAAYGALVDASIVEHRELDALAAWIADLDALREG